MARKTRVQPTHYPRVPFHLLRSAQLLSACVVGGILSYFLWQLQHDHYRMPWTFLLLLSVSLLTVPVLLTTIILHCCCGLNPLLNVILNSILLLLWTVGFALLSWWSSGTLSHVCNKANWDSATGIAICRAYKALFAFSLLGFVSTLLATALDVRVYRRATRLGKYNQMQNLDNKRAFDAGDEVLALEEHPVHNNRGGSRYERVDGGSESLAVQDTGYYGSGGVVR